MDMPTTKKVRLGFIGAGWWATANYMPLLARRDDVELTAVCRLGRDELRRVQHVLCHMASPIRDLLEGKPFETQGNTGQAGDVLFQPDPRTWADPQVAGGGYGHAQLSHSTGLLCWLTGLVPEVVAAFMAAP